MRSPKGRASVRPGWDVGGRIEIDDGHINTLNLTTVPRHRPETVLVLSGGGSLGAAQVGMLRPLYRAGFRPAAIVGTSIGAINGAFLAAHDAPDSVEMLRQAWLSLGAHQIFTRNPWHLLRTFLRRRSCLFEGAALLRLIETHLPVDDFATLRVPFYATTTNLTRGTKAVFHQGPLHRAIMASAAIPGILCPVEIEDELYVDGGVLAGLDLETAVELGARNILAVDLAGCRRDRVPADALGIWRRGSELTGKELTRRDLQRFSQSANIVYACPLRRTDVSPQDFSRIPALMAESEAYGEELAIRILDPEGHLRPVDPEVAA